MSIQILPAQLANQIAAGEVVERPASVVKELVENSLDAGADKIDLDIEKGGHKRICIRDNGKGIAKNELTLALSRHATSKISCLDDLENILSLGFRGEALASVSSVSRLNLTSRTQAQSEAWQAHAEGRDMQVEVLPAAHPQGTSVEVLDLFFNTPARRKFLRTEKTEFNHIDELVKRIALSRFDVSFNLKHNGKLVRRLPAIKDDASRIKRIATLCGKDFAEQSMRIQSDYQSMTIEGWLSTPGSERAQNDLQYFYVNGRMMRDKLINHAIRQAFEGLIAPETFPAFVLYFEMDPGQVDVNVHPAKHEVRFQQARLVHDFIFRAINDALQQAFAGNDSVDSMTSLSAATPNHDYIRPLQTVDEHKAHEYSSSVSSPRQGHSAGSGGTSYSAKPLVVNAVAAENYQQLMRPPEAYSGHSQGEGRSYLLVGQNLLLQRENGFFRLPLTSLYGYQLTQQFSQSVPVSQPLLMPVSVKSNESWLQTAHELYEPLLTYNVEIGWAGKRIILRKVPAGFRQFNWTEILCNLLESGHSEIPISDRLCQAIAASVDTFSAEQADQLWNWLLTSFPENWQNLVTKWATEVPLEAWLSDHE